MDCPMSISQQRPFLLSQLLVAHHATNSTGHELVLGGIHGCYGMMLEIFARASFDKELCRLFSVGDLVDRDPQSLEVLRPLCEPCFFPSSR
jgi:serine/threonine protein phosphatase 1